MRRLTVLIVVGVLLALVTPQAGVAAPSASADRWAVLIGVDSYRNGSPKSNVGSVGDVEDMRTALLRAGWASNRIVQLTNSHATGAAIRDAFRWLAANVSDRSYSVVHYSGHIKQINNDPDKDGEKLDEFLWPWDSKMISDREFGEAMRAVRGSMWVNVSGCEAAGLDDGINGPTRIFTGSSMEPEKSYEYPAWKNSVWTGLMVDQGMNQGKADINGDGAVTIDEAYRWAAPQAASITKNQSHGSQHPYANGGQRDWTLRGSDPAPSGGSSQPPPEAEPEEPPANEPPGAGPERTEICLLICIRN